MGNPQVPKINCYSLKFRQKLSQHFGDMSQCERCEKLMFTFIGVPGQGKAKPTCKAEDRRSTSRKFDWHTFCQRHYFADMSQYWDMSDPHFLGLRHDWSLHWGWEIQSQKTRLSHFGHWNLQHFGEMSQCWGISGLHYLWVLMPREGTPTFWGSKVGGSQLEK